MKVFVKKEIYESRKQCTRPIDRHISMQNLLVKEVVGLVHSAQCTGPIDKQHPT